MATLAIDEASVPWLRHAESHAQGQAQLQTPSMLSWSQLGMMGDEAAMLRVGHMLAAGYGVKQDAAEAAKWMREAW